MLRWVQSTEPVEARTHRYEEIAADAVRVAYDEAEAPLFPGPLGREKTAALLISIASYESAFSADVDRGITIGGGGEAYCLMQVQPGPGIVLEDDAYTYSPRGLHGPDLTRDRTQCFRVAMHILRVSITKCSKLPSEDRLSAYTTGRCMVGETKGRWRWKRAERAWTAIRAEAGG